MTWHWQYPALDAGLGAALAGVLISLWLVRVARRDREQTPPERMTTMEELALTIRVRGDGFRLIQQVVFLLVWADIITSAQPPPPWPWALLIVGQHALTIHSIMLLRAVRRHLPAITGHHGPPSLPLPAVVLQVATGMSVLSAAVATTIGHLVHG